MNRNIFYFNRQNKTQPSRSKTRERLTEINRLMVPDKNKINKINFLPQGHFFTEGRLTVTAGSYFLYSTFYCHRINYIAA